MQRLSLIAISCSLMLLSLQCMTSEVVALEIVAVEAADVVIVNQAAEAADNAVGQQFRAQFEPLLKVELSFVNRVCRLTDDERRTLIGKSNAWLDKFSRDYTKQHGQPQMVGAFINGIGGNHTPADVRELIQAGVETVVKAELPKEKASLYKKESTKRAEFGKQVAVDNLVARIDKELFLTPEQREKLTDSLSEHWNKSWAPQLEMFMHGMDMWPNVPDQWIRPHLTAAQQVAWSRLNKNQGQMFFNVMDAQGQVIDDIDLKEGQEAAGEPANEKPMADKVVAPVPAVAN